MKIVLDSNVLLVAIGKKSKYRPIWDAFIEGKYQLILSEDILHEYEEILLQHTNQQITSLGWKYFWNPQMSFSEECITTGTPSAQMWTTINFSMLPLPPMLNT